MLFSRDRLHRDPIDTWGDSSSQQRRTPQSLSMSAVFLSHNSRDKNLVRPLANWLKDQLPSDISVFFDESDIVLGDNISQRLDLALEECTCGLVCFGARGQGPWHNEEIAALLTKQIDHSHSGGKGDEFRLIPVLLPGADENKLPVLYRHRLWADLRAGLGDSQIVLQRLLSAITGKPGREDGTVLAPEDNPYRGLKPFTEKLDAQGKGDFLLFRGRSRQCESLARKFATEKLVLVSGASGNGKSSLARAGLRTPDADRGLNGISRWSRVYFTPGHDFFFSFLLSLCAGRDARRDTHLARIRGILPSATRASEWARIIYEALVETYPDQEQAHVLVIVDQFEEVFTHQAATSQVASSREASDILSMLQILAAENAYRMDARFHFVVTLRSEFISRCRVSGNFWEYVDERNPQSERPRQLKLDELQEEGWLEAVKGPAESAGAYFQQGLITSILKDIRKQRGSMPLLQHALEQLWLKAKGACLTITDYEISGGVSGSLGKTADDKLKQICESTVPNAPEVCRSIILRLVSFGEGVPDTRRRVMDEELEFGKEYETAKELVLRVLQEPDCRLLTHDGAALEVTHDALIRECGTVNQWLEDARRSCDLPFFRQLGDATIGWIAGGKKRADLWSSHRLKRHAELYDSVKTAP